MKKAILLVAALSASVLGDVKADWRYRFEQETQAIADDNQQRYEEIMAEREAQAYEQALQDRLDAINARIDALQGDGE